MLGDAVPDGFRFYFPENFIDKKVKDKFHFYADAAGLPYDDITDYLNANITGTSIPGIFDEGSAAQHYDKGRTRTFKSSKPAEENMLKEIDIDMKMKESYLNWFILHFQFLEFLKNDRTVEKNFFPPVYLQVLDITDQVVLNIIFRYVRMKRLSDIKFATQDNNIVSKEFTLTLTYNEIDFQYNHDKIKK